MGISVILCPFVFILSLYSRLLKKIQRRGARKIDERRRTSAVRQTV
jgi:hypothetical protein